MWEKRIGKYKSKERKKLCISFISVLLFFSNHLSAGAVYAVFCTLILYKVVGVFVT